MKMPNPHEEALKFGNLGHNSVADNEKAVRDLMAHCYRHAAELADESGTGVEIEMLAAELESGSR